MEGKVTDGRTYFNPETFNGQNNKIQPVHFSRILSGDPGRCQSKLRPMKCSHSIHQTNLPTHFSVFISAQTSFDFKYVRGRTSGDQLEGQMRVLGRTNRQVQTWRDAQKKKNGGESCVLSMTHKQTWPSVRSTWPKRSTPDKVGCK